jgi:hypothetical protein
MLFVQRAFTAKVYRYQAALQSFYGDFPFRWMLLSVFTGLCQPPIPDISKKITPKATSD